MLRPPDPQPGPTGERLFRELVAQVRMSLKGVHVQPKVALRPAQMEMLAHQKLDVLVESLGPGSLSTVTVSAPDQVGLLATVAGVLAVNRLDVRGARAISQDGMALSEWFVDPGFSPIADTARLREDMRLALSGSLNLAARLARREEGYSETSRQLALEPRVEVVPDASDLATLLEVRTYDRSGALYRLATAIAECGFDVMSARADTLGSNVVDVFYVRNGAGLPLNADEVTDAVKRLLAVASV